MQTRPNHTVQTWLQMEYIVAVKHLWSNTAPSVIAGYGAAQW